MPVTNGIFHDFDVDGDIFKSWSKNHAMISFSFVGSSHSWFHQCSKKYLYVLAIDLYKNFLSCKDKVRFIIVMSLRNVDKYLCTPMT